MSERKIGFSVYETIGIGIINPRAIDPFRQLRIEIIDFCYFHSSTEQMKLFAANMLTKHKVFAHRIKDEILKVCPQYKDMLEKMIVLL